MSYTVKKLAKLSGVSTRTLRFYDKIGLLKPAYYGENNYRYYEEEQVLLLRQILFYRELNFSLDDIQRMVNAEDFNNIEALLSHKQVIKENLNRSRQLMKKLDQTIQRLRGDTVTNDEVLLKGFAHQFIYDSYVSAFAPGNDHLLDNYFDPDLMMFNHASSKKLYLQDLKLMLPRIHRIFNDLQSEIKDVFTDEDSMAFRIEQRAVSTKHNLDGENIKLNTMNVYKLKNGKVREWQIWVNES